MRVLTGYGRSQTDVPSYCPCHHRFCGVFAAILPLPFIKKTSQNNWPVFRKYPEGSNIIIEMELVRMRTHADCVVIPFAHLEYCLKHVFGKDIAFEQEFVILFQCLHCTQK